ncbi:hypothetical protein C8Q73DRAFT_409441 [Cubamyces lactineus]|nr:hypothetical protein C8Q73DRAFT_409441 [Cubamyces lactineus]
MLCTYRLCSVSYRLISYPVAFLQCSFCFRFLVTCTFALQIGPPLSPVRMFLPPGRRRCPLRYSLARRLRRRPTPFHDHPSRSCLRSARCDCTYLRYNPVSYAAPAPNYCSICSVSPLHTVGTVSDVRRPNR